MFLLLFFKALPIGPTQVPFGNTDIKVNIWKSNTYSFFKGSSVNAVGMWTQNLALRAGEDVGNTAHQSLGNIPRDVL